MKVDIRDADLAALVARVRAGEEVVIEDGAVPVARLVPAEGAAEGTASRPFVFGLMRGDLGRTPDFFEPMDEEDLRLWEGEGHPGDPAR